jgi:raffinose/stachyose/melibiose transport system substrate-binding protein
MIVALRRAAWIGSLVAAAALLSAGPFPGVLEAAGGQVNIIEWVNPPAVRATQAVDAGFEHALHIKANLTTAVNRRTNYAALEKTSVQSGSQDIMAVFPIQPYPTGMPRRDLSSEQLWGVDGVYLPLDSQPWVKDLRADSRAVQTYKGHLYGLNTGVYQIGVFYNKAMFAKYHLSPPRTLDRFFALAAQLKKNGETPLWFGVGGGAVQYEWIMLMDSQLMAIYGNTNVNDAFWSGQAKFTDPKFVQALTQAKQITSVMEPNWQGENWTQMPGAFASGKAAMLLDGSWDMASVLRANPGMDIGYFPLPGSNDAARNVSILQPDLTWVVLKNAKNQSNALAWLNYFSKSDVYAQYVTITGISPSFNGDYPSDTAKILGSYLSTGLLEANAEPSLPSAGPFGLQPPNFYNTLQQVLIGQLPPQQAAQQWQTAWESMMHK